MSISVERHLAIGHPTSDTPNKILFWAPILFSITYNIPKFFELELVYPPDEIICQSNSTQCSSEKLENFFNMAKRIWMISDSHLGCRSNSVFWLQIIEDYFFIDHCYAFLAIDILHCIVIQRRWFYG